MYKVLAAMHQDLNEGWVPSRNSALSASTSSHAALPKPRGTAHPLDLGIFRILRTFGDDFYSRRKINRSQIHPVRHPKT